MMTPLVSVVTPAFNAVGSLQLCIRSVQRQSLIDWEHLIVDDGSGDGTLELARQAARADPRIRVFASERSGGAAAARNRALDEARGRYVAFLDADDIWLPDKLSVQIGAMRESGVPFSYGSYYIRDGEDGGPVGRFVPPGRVAYAELLRGCAIGCSTVAIDRDVAGPLHMPAFRRGQDWALWLLLAKRGLEMSRFPGTHVVYQRRRGSLSSAKLRKLGDLWRIYREQESASPLRALVLLAHHVHYVGYRKNRGKSWADLPEDFVSL